MEILNTYTKISYIFQIFLSISVSTTIFCLFAFFISDKKIEKITTVFVILSLVIINLYTFKYSTKDLYQAKVNDWNEVYNNGFEVVKIEGELVTLRKTTK